MSTGRTTSAKTYTVALFSFFFAPLLVVACGASPPKEAAFGAAAPMASRNAAVEGMQASVADRPSAQEAQRIVNDASPTDLERKLVHRGGMTIQVASLVAGEASVRALASKAGGYVSAAYGDESRVSLTLRVPFRAFESILEGLSPLGRVLSRNVSTEDVSLSYYDLEGRLKTKQALAETFRGYLRGARTIEDILAVESRLADLQNEIDSLGGQFAHLRDLIDFSTIDVHLTLPVSALPDGGPTLGDRLAQIFRGFGSFLSLLLAGIVACIVFGIPSVTVATIAYWLLFGKIGLLIRLYRLVARRREV